LRFPSVALIHRLCFCLGSAPIISSIHRPTPSFPYQSRAVDRAPTHQSPSSKVALPSKRRRPKPGCANRADSVNRQRQHVHPIQTLGHGWALQGHSKEGVASDGKRGRHQPYRQFGSLGGLGTAVDHSDRQNPLRETRSRLWLCAVHTERDCILTPKEIRLPATWTSTSQLFAAVLMNFEPAHESITHDQNLEVQR
jgi:hypothetical protein